VCGQISWPVTWIEGDSSTAKSLTGTQAYAVARATVTPVEVDGKILGSVFEDEDAKYCYLGNIHSVHSSAPRHEQTRETFEKIEICLAKAGMSISSIVRTWLYVDKILSWYDEFNRVRTEFFNDRGVFDGIVPASTGIGVGNPMDTALIADVFAIKPKDGDVTVREVSSPLQCSAEDYSSSFSRAIETVIADCRTLYVSGTASISPDGKTEHVGDAEKQIALTMAVIQQILESCNMSWADASRAVAYFKSMEDVRLFEKYCAANDLTGLPVVVAHADICRNDLLFEMEVDAIR